MRAVAAVGFLTRLPVPAAARDIDAAARTQALFPAVGLVLGALLLAADRLLTRALPDPSADVALVVALAALTGALHLDGLADTTDGLLGGADRGQRLAIMRDVRTGSFGTVAVVSVLGLKWAGLAALPRGVRFESLLLVPCLARWAMTLAVAGFPSARPDGLGASFHAAASPASTAIAGASAVALSVALLGAGGALVFVVAGALAAGAGAIASRAVGGMTGDIAGAIVEVSEALLLLFVAALAQRGWLDAWVLG